MYEYATVLIPGARQPASKSVRIQSSQSSPPITFRVASISSADAGSILTSESVPVKGSTVFER